MMNDSARVIRRPRRARPPIARTAAAIIATAVLALVSAACSSGSPSSTGPGGSTHTAGSANSQLLAFARCVRSHGVPNFPDPQAGATNAKFPSAQQLGIGNSQLSAAENACQHLLPTGIDDQFAPAEIPLLLPGMRRFSRCVRSRGVPNWPDPTVDSEGRPGFNLVPSGIDTGSSQVNTATRECQHLLPRALGGIPVSQRG
jgi:hypothetical protein